MSDVRTNEPNRTQQSAPRPVRQPTFDQGAQETRRSFTTSEFYVWAVVVVGLLTVGYLDDAGLGRDQAWQYASFVSIAYIISRGLAKIASRNEHIDLR